MKGTSICFAAVLLSAVLAAQQAPPPPARTGLTAAQIEKPSRDAWPTYNGDYSGRRFSPLTKINDSNISSLSLAWVYRANAGGGGMFGGAIKATPVVVDGVMYLTLPDHVWAIDARTGREIWHYAWQ